MYLTFLKIINGTKSLFLASNLTESAINETNKEKSMCKYGIKNS
jgi:hypothetical protein